MAIAAATMTMTTSSPSATTFQSISSRNLGKTLPLPYSAFPKKRCRLMRRWSAPKFFLMHVASTSEKLVLLVVMQGRFGGSVVALFPGYGSGRSGTAAHDDGERIIRCGGPVDDDMANIIVAQLLYLDAVDPTKDIVMYVNSPGGSVTAGMAIFDTMKHIRPDVSTVCVGLAASMGAFLLSSGTKGKRYSLPNSRIMIHQPIGGAQGVQTEIEIQANEIFHHKANLASYLAYHTGQSLDKINQDTDRDFFMSAEEAKDYGMIDGVITNPLKALQPLPAS
ncbi:hypothetical protein ZIOFF_045983 [Zingiber officinale]|uniref:ATP-dependent Clp protease proteolytic subunit n=1 Tax=Zingiber officinale TaxID=94328 RepID=A0A8J5G4R3_ZINOF|nr:hypothetical protein ZIOFF_045983 [Zingiber officinale]